MTSNSIDLDHFMRFCKGLEGHKPTTLARNAPFMVSVFPEGLKFIVLSTGKVREHRYPYIRKVHERFVQTGSFRTGWCTPTIPPSGAP